MKINLKLALLFLPVAYASYLFHEFGHWITGEILGNDMVYSLNYVYPESGQYVDARHNVYVSMGGPAFTILLSLVFLVLIERYRIVYAFPVVFFQFFCRFFSLVFGGFSKQDEARIAQLLDIWKYTIALIVLAVLVLALVRASYLLRVNLKNTGIFFAISTVCQFMVIGTYELMSYINDCK